MKRVFSLIAVLALAGSASGETLLNMTEGNTNGTFNSSGRRSEDYYFNIQDSSNGSYACWSAVKWTGLDLGVDPGNIVDADITLQLEQNNSGFTTNGNFDVYIMPDTFNPSANAYYADWANTYQAQSSLVDTFAFTELSPNYQEVDYNVTGSLADTIANNAADGTLVLGFAENGTVSATFSGVTNTYGPGPSIKIEGNEVPEPSTLVGLLSAGLMGLGLAVRRRKAA